MPPASVPALSVLIPTRDRPVQLATCLSTLGAQDCVERLEVVVIDDGSAPEVAEVVATAQRGFPQLRCLRQEGAGANVARNAGAAAARAALLAYLDDDVLVDPEWARALLASHATHGWDAAGGRIVLALPGPPPRWLHGFLREALSEFNFGPSARWLGVGTEPVCANCALTRESFDRLGGFRDDLGRRGASLLSNEETELFRRLIADGGRIAYVPEAVVAHQIPAERLTSAWFTRRFYAQGVSDEQLEPTVGSRYRALAELFRHVVPLPRLIAGGILRRRGIVLARAQLAYVRGRADAVLGRERA